MTKIFTPCVQLQQNVRFLPFSQVHFHNTQIGTVAACPGADCVNVVGSFKCKCKAGYKIVAGQCRDIDECQNGSHDCASVASGKCVILT